MTTPYKVTPGQAVSAQLAFSNLPTGASTSADCYNLPAAINCSYSAQTEQLTLTTGTSTPPGTYQILVVTTVTPQTTTSALGQSREVWSCLLGLPLGLIWFGRKRRRWLYPAAGILGLFLVTMVGCSSGSGTGTTTTPAVKSQVSTTLTLTVN
jgi:hypothetical protein